MCLENSEKVKMRIENKYLVIWIIFGFTLVKALDTVVYFFNHLIFYFGLWLNLGKETIQFSFYPINIFLYVLMFYLILKYWLAKLNNVGIVNIDFPKVLFVILVLIVVGFSPLFNKLIGLYSFQILENYRLLNNLGFSDVNTFYLSIIGIQNFIGSLAYIGAVIWVFIITKNLDKIKGT